MLKGELGRITLGNVTLVEYDNLDSTTFFVQCGICGFNMTQKELHDLGSLISYYDNIDTIDNIEISIREEQ